jgi:hypothetical protein
MRDTLAAAWSRTHQRRRRLVRAIVMCLAAAAGPLRVGARVLDRVVVVVDGSPQANTPAGTRLRRGLASLVAVYAVVLYLQGVGRGELISPVGLLMLMMAVALYVGRGGRFVRDWVPVFLAATAYIISARAVPTLGVPIHFKPQLEIDRLIGLGSNPTVWLQSHLYDGATGALEVFSIAMYVSHFLAPLLLAFLLWVAFRGRGFTDLFFGILVVTVLGEITFLLAPTAPPWMAGDQGLLLPVHHIIKDGLSDLGFTSLAAHKDEPGSYNLVAAVPSLHAAWPMIGLLVIRAYRLPRWLFALQAIQLAGVLFAIVYTGEHYVIDAVVGLLYAVAAWRIVTRIGAQRVATLDVAASREEEQPEAAAA